MTHPVELLLKTTQSPSHTAPPASHDLEKMEASLKSVVEMIDRLLAYVRQVIKGEVEGDERTGKYLLDALRETSEGVGVDKGQLEGLFNAHLQVSLAVMPSVSMVIEEELSRTLLWSHILQTLFVHKWKCPLGSHL